MNMPKIEQMEKKYGICIRDDSYYHPITGKFQKQYKIYTADGCLWENGLNFRELQKECRENGDKMRQIYDKCWFSMF